MKTDPLQLLGLTGNEIRVYNALLKQDSTTASELAESTGMYRKNVYDSLYSLIKKGIASYSKSEQGRTFSAANPACLNSMMDVQLSRFKSALQKLKKTFEDIPAKEDITIFKGKEGIKSVFDDISSSQQPTDAFGSGQEFRQLLPFYFSQFQKKKADNAVISRAICPPSERDSYFAKEFSGVIRFLTPETRTTTLIYGSKLAIIDWQEMTAVIIRNLRLAQSYETYFNHLWAIAEK
jgi:sugar-specific transcriptional regulator TrmB